METAELFTVTELVQPSCPCCSVFIAHGHRCACVVFARVSSRVFECIPRLSVKLPVG